MFAIRTGNTRFSRSWEAALPPWKQANLQIFTGCCPDTASSKAMLSKHTHSRCLEARRRGSRCRGPDGPKVGHGGLEIAHSSVATCALWAFACRRLLGEALRDAREEVGFEHVTDWRSCFWHPKLELFLVVYVDDFKLAGPKERLNEGWKLIRSGIETDEPHPMGMFLGCSHEVAMKASPWTGKQVQTMTYNMQPYLESAVAKD